jgi:hypothetical protein
MLDLPDYIIALNWYGTAFFVGLMAYHLRKINAGVAKISSILERMERERPQSAPAPSPSGPPDAL